MGELLPEQEVMVCHSTQRIPRPFIAEALVSAGPRKSIGDYKSDPTDVELCEDCAGICWTGSRLVFWLCDGASDGILLPRLTSGRGSIEGKYVPVGSARILAQDLGQAFAEQACVALEEDKPIIAIDLPAVVAGAGAKVAASWQERLTAFLAAYETEESRKTLAAELPFAGEGYLLDWSSTFTGGVFDPQEQILVVVNYGSSGGVVIGKQSPIIAPNDYPVALMAWVKPEERICSDVKAIADADIRREIFDEVEGFAIVSDGLDRYDLSTRLRRLQGKSYSRISELRTDLLSGADQTGDDKAVIFGRFL